MALLTDKQCCGIGVNGLTNLGAVEQQSPADVIIARRRLHVDRLELTEVGDVHVGVLGTVVQSVDRAVTIRVVLADIAHTVT